MKPIRRSYSAQELSELTALAFTRAALAPEGPERDELLKLADGYRARVAARHWVEDQIDLSPVPKISYH
jgi:hypothetical protein